MIVGRYSFYLAECSGCYSKFKFRLIRHMGMGGRSFAWDTFEPQELRCMICGDLIPEHAIKREQD